MNHPVAAAPVAAASLFIALTSCAVGKVDRPESIYAGSSREGDAPILVEPPAEPRDPDPITDGDVTEAWVRGIHVLVKRVPGAELVSGQLHIRGGVRNWPTEQAGIEGMALECAITGGTVGLDRDQFQRRLASLGSTLSSDSGNDYSLLAMKSLVDRFEETFALLASAFLEPALAEPAIEVERRRRIAGLRHESEDPDERVQRSLYFALFTGHPYERRPEGTEQSISALNREALAAHLVKLRDTSRLLFVVVGDVDPPRVIELVRSAFARVPRGAHRDDPLPSIRFDRPRLVVDALDLPTNYVVGAFAAPSWRDRNFAAARVAMWLLGERVFEEVRTKRNLSYAPHAALASGDAVTYGVLYVTAVEADTAWKVMLAEAERLKREPVGQEELAGTKELYLTRFWAQNETTDGQAALLATRQLLAGDWRKARSGPEEIRAVTPEEIRAFAAQYLRRLQTVVLGPAKPDRGLFESL